MTSGNQDQPANAMTKLTFDARVSECLEDAKGFSRMTGDGSVGGSHIALSLFASNHNLIDQVLKELFSGLRKETLFESLLDILQNDGEAAPPSLQEPMQREAAEPPGFSEEGVGVIQRAGDLAEKWGLDQITLAALAGGVFEKPNPQIIMAFKDGGIKLSGLELLAQHLAKGAERSEIPSSPLIFQDGILNRKAFGPVTQGALGLLDAVAAEHPDRNLRDVDLIYCLIQQEHSLFVEALHLIGSPVTSIRSSLELLVGGAAVAPRSFDLREEKMSRLLRRVFEEAKEAAIQEGCALVSESHLIRAHLARVVESTTNIYQRLGINTVRLKSYLARYTTDRATERVKESETAIEEIESSLSARVIHQETAIRKVVPALRLMRSGLGEPDKLLGKFLFLGPTGVGKTELALAMADVVFGQKEGIRDPYLIRIDCERFKDKEDIVQLVGARQGLVGYKEGRLTNGLREKPRAVILFDEVEKAHKEIWQSLLTFLDDGIVFEADGTEYNARNCIFVGTSNAGYKEAIERFHLWQLDRERRQSLRPQIEEFIWSHVTRYFSPEFLGRIGKENVLYFSHFDLSDYQAIVRLQVKRLIEEMKGRGMEVSVSDPSVINLLADMAWQRREEGARPVRRLITHHLRNQIVDARIKDPNRTSFSFFAEEGSGQIALTNR
jgi:ATP-dependent Clp protease ATP-binding subunit ClpA